MPFLTYPLAFLALAALPALAAIYFFRNRFKKHPVSSLALWQRISQPKQGGSRLTRFQTPLWFLLEILAIIFIVLAAIDPRWPLDAAKKPLTLVLDNSASMRSARESGISARQIALNKLDRLLASDRYRIKHVLLAGTEPELIESATGEFNHREISTIWKCMSPASKLSAAVALGLQSSHQATPLLVLTDHPPPAELEIENIKWQSCGKDASNLAFINASRTKGDQSDNCLLEVANYSQSDANTEVAISGVGSNANLQEVDIPAGESRTIRFGIPPSTESITASLPSDALEIDNRINLLKPLTKRPRVKVRIANGKLAGFTSRAVAVSGLQSEETGAAEIVFTDQESEAAATPSAWVVRILESKKPKAFTGPYVVNRNHPVSQGVNLNGVIWGAARTNRIDGLPIITAGNVPLVTDTSGIGGKHRIALQFSPSMSTLQHSTAWPTLVWNILRWRSRTLPGISKANTRTGADLTFNATSPTDKLTLQPPRGKATEISASADQTILNPAIPGIYRLTANSKEYTFSANFLSPEESNLSDRQEGEWGNLIGDETIRGEMRSTAWLFVLLALGILTAHLIAINRNNTTRTF